MVKCDRAAVPLRVTTLVWVATALATIACDTANEVDRRVMVDSVAVRPSAPADTTSVVVDASPAVALRAALQQTLRGPTDPEPGKHSWFSAATANALRSVSVDSTGHATVDFEDLRARIPNASSSAGSAILLEELNAAVFSVGGIRSVDYLIEGSCAKFWEWLQYGCQTIRRP